MLDLRTRVIRLAAALPRGVALRHLLTAAVFESQLDVGDPCYVAVQGHRVEGNIRAVTFTAGKVRYDVQVWDEGGYTTLHNLDSVLVSPRPGGERYDTSLDNYS